LINIDCVAECMLRPTGAAGYAAAVIAGDRTNRRTGGLQLIDEGEEVPGRFGLRLEAFSL